MKLSLNDRIFLTLTIVLLAISTGLYFVFGGFQKSENTSNSQSSSLTTSSSSATPETAETAVKTLEDNQNANNLSLAQNAVNSLSNDTANKAALQHRIDAVSVELSNQNKAEELVKTAEANPTYTNITAAQEAVNIVGLESVKANLQTRLNSLNANTVITNQ